MTERNKLEEMRLKFLSSEGDTYERLKKVNVLEKLIAATDSKTGKIWEQIIIPMYEHDGDFLKKTLGDLGYSPDYKEEFNYFWDTMCYTVTL